MSLIDSNATSQLFRADHLKKHAYHLVIQRIDNNDASECSNNAVDITPTIYNYSVAVLGQLGFILDYGDLKCNGPLWRRDRILTKFGQKVKLDDQASYDASLEVEAEFISQRFYLHSTRPLPNLNTFENHCSSDSQDPNNSTHAHIKTSFNDIHCSNNNDLNDVKYILDGTCGVGGNLIPLAKHFICIGIELTPQRCDICRHNLKVYQLDHRAIVINADLTEFLTAIDFQDPESFKTFGMDVTKPPFDKLLKNKFSWILISPPWGSVAYPGSADNATYHFTDIKSMDIKQIAVRASELSDNVSLMLPRSQNIPDLIHLSHLTNLPFVTLDLLYKSMHNPLPRLCYAHFTSQLMDKCGQIKRKRADMSWSVDPAEAVDIAVAINYNPGKVNLVGLLPTSTPFVDINVSPFIRALGESILSAINEPIHPLPKLISIIEILGMKEIQSILQDAFSIYHSGGMKYTLDGITKNRTFGGIFFFLFKNRYCKVYKIVEKNYKLKSLKNR